MHLAEVEAAEYDPSIEKGAFGQAVGSGKTQLYVVVKEKHQCHATKQEVDQSQKIGYFFIVTHQLTKLTIVPRLRIGQGQ